MHWRSGLLRCWFWVGVSKDLLGCVAAAAQEALLQASACTPGCAAVPVGHLRLLCYDCHFACGLSVYMCVAQTRCGGGCCDIKPSGLPLYSTHQLATPGGVTAPPPLLPCLCCCCSWCPVCVTRRIATRACRVGCKNHYNIMYTSRQYVLPLPC